jgi:hypothetical protein
MAKPPQSPLLALPGELRNLIYTFVAHSTTSIKLYKGDLVPPPLANTCRQIRKEMSGNWYTQEVALDHTTPITAHMTNFDFSLIYKWVDTYDKRPAEQKKFLRILDIELFLVSPSSGPSRSSPSSLTLATKPDVQSHAEDHDAQLKARFGTDYQAIFTCDSNWVDDLNNDLLALGRATYGVDKDARAANAKLYSPTGSRRRFTESLAGNGYLTSINTRVEYGHHSRAPLPKPDRNRNTTPAAAVPALPAFTHATSYLTLLTNPLRAIVPSTTCMHALCIRQFRRRIYLGLLNAQTASQALKWNREYYSNLSADEKKS